MAQKNTSKDTSINNKKLPAVYNEIDFGKYSSVLDYGCGAYTEHLIEKANKTSWKGYDPFNLPGSQMENAELIICSNVLNVIDDDEALKEAIHNIFKLGSTIIISIYEGPDKIKVPNKNGKLVNRPSGIGRQTKKDCWQRNESIDTYLDLIHSLGYEAEIKHGFIYGVGLLAA